MRGDKRAMQRLRRACENVKRSLSTQTSAAIELEALKDGVDLRETLSRARFEEVRSRRMRARANTAACVA